MTWLDYRKPPGTNWADPNASGSVRTFRGALVLLDYPNQPFVVTQPQGSTVFGNPSAEASGVPRRLDRRRRRRTSPTASTSSSSSVPANDDTATCLAVAR